MLPKSVSLLLLTIYIRKNKTPQHTFEVLCGSKAHFRSGSYLLSGRRDDLAWQLTQVACQAASPVTHPNGSGGAVGRRRHMVAASPDASSPSLSSVMAMLKAHARWYEPPFLEPVGPGPQHARHPGCASTARSLAAARHLAATCDTWSDFLWAAMAMASPRTSRAGNYSIGSSGSRGTTMWRSPFPPYWLLLRAQG